MITTCDCGAPCHDGRLGCDHCRFLDGANTGEASVIAAMRLVGKAAPCEIADMTGLHTETIGRVLKRLKGKGRVKFLGIEVYIHESNRRLGRVNQSARHYYELVSS
jgi:DNA-binding MarR family transcriptional regulator